MEKDSEEFEYNLNIYVEDLEGKKLFWVFYTKLIRFQKTTTQQ